VALITGLLYTIASLLLYAVPAWKASAFLLLRDMRTPSFADLRWVTATSECGVDLDSLYADKVGGCDAFGRMGIGYPPMSIWLFRLVDFKAAWTGIFGLATGLLFMATSAWILLKTGGSKTITLLTATLLIWGYPMQLALERMNIDVLVFLLVFLHCCLLSLPSSPWLQIASLPLTAINVGLKIYPLFGYLSLLLLTRPVAALGKRVISLSRSDGCLIAIGCIIGLITAAPILIGNDSVPAGSVSAGEGSLGSHGLKAFGFINENLVSLAGLERARLIIKALFALKLISLATGYILTLKLGLAKAVSSFMATAIHPKRQKQLTYTTIAMTGMWLGCYLTTISFDYRTIFLIPLISLLTQTAALTEGLWNRAWAWLVCLAGLLPGITTTLHMAIPIYERAARVYHEIIAEFLLFPLLASATAAILIQLLGLPSLLKPAPPAPARALRDPCR